MAGPSQSSQHRNAMFRAQKRLAKKIDKGGQYEEVNWCFSCGEDERGEGLLAETLQVRSLS
jgi:hypothetical protein